MTTRRWVTWAFVAVAVAACEDPAGIAEGASLTFQDEALVIDAGQRIDVAFAATDAEGRGLDASRVSWNSTDPTTARVANGIVEGVAPGVVHVFGDVGGARDSVRVRVRVTDLLTGEVAGRAAGSAPTSTERFSGLASFSESMLGDFPSTSIIRPVSGEPDPRERFQAEIRVPGRIEAGERTLDVYTVSEFGGRPFLAGDEGVALFRLRSLDPLVWEMWVAVGSPRLEIESIRWPIGPGLDEGLVRGNASFEAAGLVVEGFGPDTHIVGQVADSTSAYYVEFATPLRHFVAGGGTLEPGGRLAAPTAPPSGYAFLRDGGLGMNLSLVTLPNEPGGVQYSGNVDGWMPTVVAGPTSLPASGDEIFDPVEPDRTRPWLRLRFRSLTNGDPGPVEFAASSGGSVTVTEYVPPSALLVGRLAGTFETVLAVWSEGVPTGETIPLLGTFTLPVYPEGWR